MERITFETAKLATEKGYRNVPWEKDYHIIPYQAELQDWLRTVHNIHVAIDCNASGWYTFLQETNGTFIKSFVDDGPNNGGVWNTCEEAVEYGLQQALTLI